MAHAQALRSLRGHREAPTGQGGSRSADLPAWVPGSGSQSWFRGHIRPLAGAGPLSLHGWAVSTDGGLARYGAGGGTAPPSPSLVLMLSNAVDMPHRKKINERVGIQSFLFQIAALHPGPILQHVTPDSSLHTANLAKSGHFSICRFAPFLFSDPRLILQVFRTIS